MPEPGTITQLSPSTLAALRRCGLATYYRRSSSAGTGKDGPSNPVARLGNAAHRVLAWVAASAEELATHPAREEAVRQRWNHEAATEAEASAQQPSEAAFGPIDRWPRFATIQESVVVDGAALAVELAEVPPTSRMAEKRLHSHDGHLFGTVDLVIVDDDQSAIVIDHKAGLVSEGDFAPGGRYHAQLLLYAALVRDLGLKPRDAELRPVGRARISIPVNDAVIDHVVAAADADLADYNGHVAAGTADELARPSQAACEWCEFLLCCPAVWAAAPPDLGEVHTLEGKVLAIQTLASGSTAMRLQLPGGADPALVTGLTQTRTPALSDIAVGVPVRIVGLRRNARGTYRAGPGRLDLADLTDPLGVPNRPSVERAPQEAEWREDGD